MTREIGTFRFHEWHGEAAPSRQLELPRERDREIERLRGAMREIGKFRVVRPKDLEQWHYSGDRAQAVRDLGTMERAGFVERRSVLPDSDVLMLTDRGRLDLYRADGRKYRAGSPLSDRFIAHDVQVYPAYREAVAKLEAQGATIRGVIFEREMRGKLNRRMTGKEPGPLLVRQKEEIAKELNLRVVDGAIRVPDLRVEYDDRRQEPRKLDLEITTGTYTAKDIGRKVGGGMRLMGDNHVGSKLWDDHHVWR